MATLTPPVSISLENEKNPWLAAAARFDEAATRLNLDDGMRKVLRHARQGNHRPHPGAARRRPPRGLHRLSRAALPGARPGQGRHPLRARRDAGRSARAGLLDDLEVRGGQHPVRRRQGRRDLRSATCSPMPSWKSSRAATRPRSSTSSGRSATCPRRTSTPTSRSWRGSWTPTPCTRATRSRRWSPASRWRWAARAAGRKPPAAAA